MNRDEHITKTFQKHLKTMEMLGHPASRVVPTSNAQTDRSTSSRTNPAATTSKIVHCSKAQ